MNRTRPANTMQRRDRRGAVVGLLLLGMVFLTGFAALAVNVSRLRHIQTQLRASCRSAALAGAAELLDEGVLYGAPTQVDDIWSARQAACFYAARNPIDGQLLVLDANTANNPQGDLVVGWINPAGPVGQLLQLPIGSGPHEANTLRVTARMGRNVADRITLWFGGMVGITSFDISAQAQASLDRRVVGFRPEPGVKVPLVPLVADYASWFAAATQLADPETNDLYAVNPLTGQVTAGADGIPEMTLMCGQPTSADSSNATTEQNATDPSATDPDATSSASSTTVACAAITLFNELGVAYVWPVRCREGLSAGDLRDYGGELVIAVGGRPVAVEAIMPQDLPYGLMDVVGQSRVWALGEPNAQAIGVVNIIGFGAGRIVAVRPVENSQTNAWEFVVQPATLVSSQAVAAPAMVPNPWIAKLELTQ